MSWEKFLCSRYLPLFSLVWWFSKIQDSFTHILLLKYVALWFKIQGKKEIGELKVKLQEMNQLHEQAVNEVQSLKLERTDLSEEKVRLTYKKEKYGSVFFPLNM